LTGSTISLSRNADADADDSEIINRVEKENFMLMVAL